MSQTLVTYDDAARRTQRSVRTVKRWRLKVHDYDAEGRALVDLSEVWEAERAAYERKPWANHRDTLMQSNVLDSRVTPDRVRSR